MTCSRSALSRLIAVAAFALPCSAALAADSDAQARFRSEMAVCDSGRSNQDRATCREEARNALGAARRGGLDDAPGQYVPNAQQRCAALAGDDRTACFSRMRGEGSVQGSAAGGGIMRELVTTVPAK